MNIEYGPDQQRWYSCLSENIRQYPNSTQESSLTEPSVQTAAPYRRLPEEYRSVVYAGNYEKVTEGEDIVREFYYLDNGVIVVKQNGVFTPYQAFTDNLGSVLSILNEEGEKVFDAEYDAWGNQTISKNEIEFHKCDLKVIMIIRSGPMTNKYDLWIEEKRQLIEYALQNGCLPPGNKLFK